MNKNSNLVSEKMKFHFNPLWWLDQFVEKTIDLFTFLDKNYTDTWFTFLEWITVTAGFFAVGKATKSRVILTVAVFSALLIWFKAMFIFQNTIEKKLSEARTNQKFYKPIFYTIAAVVGVIPVALILLISKLISGLVLQSTSSG